MTAFWTQTNYSQNGQVRHESFNNTAVAGGVAYRELFTVFSGQPSQISGDGGINPVALQFAEASCVVPGGSGALTYTLLSQTTYYDRTVTVYSATSGSHTVYLTVTVQNAGVPSQVNGAGGAGPGGTKMLSVSMFVD